MNNLKNEPRMMNKDTLIALKGSIKKWQKIVNRKGEDSSSGNCPLCVLFNSYCKVRDSNQRCVVYQKTGRMDCDMTPFRKWANHHEAKHNIWGPHKIECPTCKQLARKELKFLKSLLPSGIIAILIALWKKWLRRVKNEWRRYCN